MGNMIDDNNLVPLEKSGWKVEIKNTEVQLSKSIKDGNIFVNWNVNGSVPDMNNRDDDETVDSISLPDFNVSIEKPTKKASLVFHCFFPEGQSENDESVPYEINSDNIDPDTYDNFVDYLHRMELDN